MPEQTLRLRLSTEPSAGLLHWFTGPYVHRLSHDKGSNTVEVTTLSFLAKPIRLACGRHLTVSHAC